MTHPLSKPHPKSNKTRKERHLSVRSIKQEEPDLQKITNAVYAMAIRMHEQDKLKNNGVDV